MLFSQIRNFGSTCFYVPRVPDSEVLKKFGLVFSEINVSIQTIRMGTIISSDAIEIEPSKWDELLADPILTKSIIIKRISILLNTGIEVALERKVDPNNHGEIVGNQDKVIISGSGAVSKPGLQSFVETMTVARDIFGAIDTKAYQDFLAEDERKVYAARDENLKRLEQMQERFFENVMKASTEQQNANQEFQKSLEDQYATRNDNLESLHLKRLEALEERDAFLRTKLCQ